MRPKTGSRSRSRSSQSRSCSVKPGALVPSATKTPWLSRNLLRSRSSRSGPKTRSRSGSRTSSVTAAVAGVVWSSLELGLMVFSSCCHLHVVIQHCRPSTSTIIYYLSNARAGVVLLARPFTKQGLASMRYLVGSVGVASYMAKVHI